MHPKEHEHDTRRHAMNVVELRQPLDERTACEFLREGITLS